MLIYVMIFKSKDDEEEICYEFHEGSIEENKNKIHDLVKKEFPNFLGYKIKDILVAL